MNLDERWEKRRRKRDDCFGKKIWLVVLVVISRSKWCVCDFVYRKVCILCLERYSG